MLHFAALMFLAVLEGAPAQQDSGTPSGKTTSVTAEEQLPYEAAYRKAREEKKPLVVLVGADWCAACRTMKSDTITPMKSTGQFKEVVFTHLDKEAHPELASQVMQGNTLPQIVVFCESDKGWKRFSLSGLQSERRVKELISKAAEVLPKRR